MHSGFPGKGSHSVKYDMGLATQAPPSKPLPISGSTGAVLSSAFRGSEAVSRGQGTSSERAPSFEDVASANRLTFPGIVGPSCETRSSRMPGLSGGVLASTASPGERPFPDRPRFRVVGRFPDGSVLPALPSVGSGFPKGHPYDRGREGRASQEACVIRLFPEAQEEQEARGSAFLKFRRGPRAP